MSGNSLHVNARSLSPVGTVIQGPPLATCDVFKQWALENCRLQRTMSSSGSLRTSDPNLRGRAPWAPENLILCISRFLYSSGRPITPDLEMYRAALVQLAAVGARWPRLQQGAARVSGTLGDPQPLMQNCIFLIKRRRRSACAAAARHPARGHSC